MRDQLHLMELVDNYLDGTMNSTDRAAFEERLRKSKELQDLLEDQQQLRRAARRSPARAAAKKAFRKYRWGRSAPGLGVGVVLLVAVTTAMFLWKPLARSGAEENMQQLDAQYARVLDDTTGTHLDPIVMMVDPETDTTVITPSGIVLDIPRGAFLDSTGKPVQGTVRVTLLEALDPLDIMKAGLSTMSGATLLETGGMFYLDAQVNGRSVEIDPTKPLTAMVPADNAKAGMQLFEGVKMPDGRIDWRNPKPLKRSLVPVDITTLNFYPPGYEAKLAELGQDVTNKAFTDSLYYSFAGTWAEPAQTDSTMLDADSLLASGRGIDPAKIKAIWNARFDNTNLATKEFEERMRAIHGTCDNAVLDLYVNNLDKDVSELDRRAGAMGQPEFDHFAARNDGRVNLPAHAADRLRKVYEKWSRAEAKAIRKTQEKFWNEQDKLDDRSRKRQDDHAMSEAAREGSLVQKELDANLDTVFKQLGYERVALPRAAYVVPVAVPGWWNVDMAVKQATATRSSMRYTDTKTGKTATLTYTPFSVEITDRKSYDQMMVYLIPKELNSYQRMEDSGFRFKERLNSIFRYDLFCIGMKGTQQFAAFQSDVQDKMELAIALAVADDNALEQMLRTAGVKMGSDLLEEAHFFDWLTTDRKRTNANVSRIYLRNAIAPIVFPCGSEAAAATGSSPADIIDRPARFPGGPEALRKYLTVSQRSPVDPFERFVEGAVGVHFWLMEDGSIGTVNITNGLFWSCDTYAKQLIKDMPRWEPAIRNRKPTSVEYSMDVRFVSEGP